MTSQFTPRFVQHESAPDRNLFMLPVAREDGEVLIATLYDKKTIRLQGMLHGSDREDLEDKIDSFKELFSRQEKSLDIVWSGGIRRYIATCSRHEMSRDFYNISSIPWTVEFTVAAGFGYDTVTSQAADAVDLTTDNSGHANEYYVETSFDFDGSKSPKPVITLELVSADPTMRGIEYKDIDTNERMLITRDFDWSTLIGRKIKIDCLEKKVYDDFVASGTFVEGTFFGTFPKFLIGTNNVRITSGAFINQRDSGGTLVGGNLLGNTTDREAQSFTVPYTDPTFGSIAFACNSEGSPAGDVIVEIQTDNDGSPSGTLVDANATATIANGDISNTREYHYVNFAGAFTLDANTKYWIVARISSGSGYVNDFNVNCIVNGYPNGRVKVSSDGGTTYTTTLDGKSLGFKLYFGGQAQATEVLHTVDYTKTYL